MSQQYSQDIRCILLCKAFQAQYDVFDRLMESLEKVNGCISLKQYSALGEFDAIFSLKIEVGSNLLQEISKVNKLFSDKLFDSIFFRPLYLVYNNNENEIAETDRFWIEDYPFLFLTIVHANHCSAEYNYNVSCRNRIISVIDSFQRERERDSSNLNHASQVFQYKVYYSLDLSDYVILWKVNEPRLVLEALRYLYNDAKFIGYTNTICTLPRQCLKMIDETKKNIGKENFSMTIRAASKSYQDAEAVRQRTMQIMEKTNTIRDSKSYFTLGNDDFLGVFPDVSPSALYDLHKIVIEDPDFRKTIFSLNTTLAIETYKESDFSTSMEWENNKSQAAIDMKESLINACKQLKTDFLDLYLDNKTVFDEFHWSKPALELLNLLYSMSKSTIFDSVCFLFLDSAHLFYQWLLHNIVKSKNGNNKSLRRILIENEMEIETFLREWDQLSDHVVRMDGTLHQTPGYEPLSYNMSAIIVEYSNAYAQKLIQYFTGLDKVSQDNTDVRIPNLASFVVPKMCRRFKTAQWFFDKYRMDSMLFITIPISKIYDSFFIMTSLTHEVSHYCSDAIRLRQQRFEHMLWCVAVLLCQQLHVNSNNAIKACVEIMDDDSKRSRLFIENDITKYYLNNVILQIKKCIFGILDNTVKMQKLHSAFCADYEKVCGRLESTDKTELALIMNRESIRMLAAPLQVGGLDDSEPIPICMQVDDIASFYKEGYSDLMMAYVLALKPDEYLYAVFLDVSMLDINDDTGKLHQRFQRAIIVCDALIESGMWSQETFDSIALWYELSLKLSIDTNYDKNLAQQFSHVYRMWKDNDETELIWKWYYPRDVLDIITHYLKNCLEEIQKFEKKSQQCGAREEINVAFRNMTSQNNNLFSKEFQNILQTNRECIIRRWQEKPFRFA